MAQLQLNQILRQIETLEEEELRQLNQAAQAKLMPQEETRKRIAFQQRLLATGLVKKIRKPRHLATSKPERFLIKAQGEPVSETIIAERR